MGFRRLVRDRTCSVNQGSEKVLMSLFCGYLSLGERTRGSQVQGSGEDGRVPAEGLRLKNHHCIVKSGPEWAEQVPIAL